jgi:hypothetical protein
MISYEDYVNLLNDRNVQLFDFQVRISYSRLNNLKIDNLIQNAGGNETFNRFGKVELENLIIKLLNKDYGGATHICNTWCKKLTL